ncbi:MAG TPA: cell wall-binding repeat-containing protein [Bacillales bacterium]|nr:cell wall-binding repeat-containing protein [Bacillales bacterium]
MQVFKSKAASILHKLAFVLLASLMFPLAAHADGNGPTGSTVTTTGPVSSPAESFSVDYDGKQSFNVGSYKVKVDNGQSSSLAILSDGETVYQKDVPLGRVENIYKWEVADQSYLVSTYRLEGSGGYLSFDVVMLADNGDAKKVFQSESYEHGGLKLANDTFSVSYTIYEKKDSQTQPSALKKLTYQLDNGEVKLMNEEKQSLDFGYVHTLSGGGTEPQTCQDVAKDADVECGSNPSDGNIAKLLTKYAVKYDIPPEIVKAIAWDESKWKQYWEDTVSGANPCQKHVEGHVVVSYDCTYRPDRPGLGIMQVTSYDPDNTEYVNQLKSSIEFNIQEGVQILANKWNYSNGGTIPEVNNNDREVLENWYFAIMAYNGISKKNDPTESNNTYQEKVYSFIEDHSLIEIPEFPVNKLDTYYKDGSTLIHFKHRQIDISGPFHLSKHFFSAGESVVTTNKNGVVNFRSQPKIADNIVDSLSPNTKLTIIGGRIPSPNKFNHFVWYHAQLADGTKGYIYSSDLDQIVELYGKKAKTRYGTSVDISQYGWPNGSNVVVLARGDLPPDALAGSVLAKKYNAPILLTKPDHLPQVVEDEMDRLKPSTVYLLGGPNAAILPGIENKLEGKGYVNKVVRLAGNTRYETAIKIARAVDDGQTNQLIIASGNEHSPDALSASSYAAAQQIPILLTKEDELSDEVKQYIKDISDQISKTWIIGGPGAVSDHIRDQLKNLGNFGIERVAGNSRFSTSVAVANRFDFNHGRVFFARGQHSVGSDKIMYIDALSGAPLAARYNAPILLTRYDEIPDSVGSWLKNDGNSEPRIFYLGGSNGAISKDVRSTIQSYLYGLPQ